MSEISGGKLVITDLKEMNNMALKISDSFSKKTTEDKMPKTMYMSPAKSIQSKPSSSKNRNPATITIG